MNKMRVLDKGTAAWRSLLLGRQEMKPEGQQICPALSEHKPITGFLREVILKGQGKEEKQAEVLCNDTPIWLVACSHSQARDSVGAHLLGPAQGLS